MIGRTPVTALLFCSLAFTSAIARAAQPTAQEPPAEYVLTVNGKAVAVALGKETEINVEGASKARIKLSRKPTRTFDKAGVKFQYPVEYTFEADSSTPDVTIWSMSGVNSIVMLQEYPKLEAKQLLAVVVPAVVMQYPAKSTKTTAISIVLAGKKLAGKRLTVRFGTVKIVQDVFAFSSSRASFTLILHDILDDSGKPTAEAAQLRKLLTSTLTFR